MSPNFSLLFELLFEFPFLIYIVYYFVKITVKKRRKWGGEEKLCLRTFHCSLNFRLRNRTTGLLPVISVTKVVSIVTSVLVENGFIRLVPKSKYT